jgi:hypothetical protein
MDGSSALVDGSSGVKVWYDQVGISQAGFQDFGIQAAGSRPLLVNMAMPNGSLHNVIDFNGNAAGTTGGFLMSARNNGTDVRITDVSSAFTAGADPTYDTQSKVTWVYVLEADTIPTTTSRTVFSSDHSSPTTAVDLQSLVQSVTGGGAIRTLGRNADNTTVAGNIFDDSVGSSAGFDAGMWYIVTAQYNATNAVANGVAANSLVVTALRQDGVSEAITVSGLTGALGAHVMSQLGARLTNNDRIPDGRMAEFLYFNDVLSDGDAGLVRGYLNEKYFVPEPSSLVLGVLSAAGVFAARNRRRGIWHLQQLDE